MENQNLNNLPPFYVGQKVVCVKTHSDGLFKVNEIFTVKNILQSKCCSRWLCDIGIKSGAHFIQCFKCGCLRPNDNHYSANCFAPIQKQSYPLISLSKVIETEKELVSAN